MLAEFPITTAPAYRRHRSEQTELYAIIKEHYPHFVREIERSGGHLPKFVRRGFCPSCGARRMVESAAHLVDHMFPEVPVRQWVLTFPFPLRFLFANDPQALSAILAVVQRAISTFVVRHSGLIVSSGARTGAVTLIQRFGSALNLNVHLHMLFLDGAYRFSSTRPAFHRARPPAGEELNDLLDTLSRRSVPPLEEAPSNPLLARRSGFSLHAATVCEAWQQSRLERLCRTGHTVWWITTNPQPP